jgi:hypothetical protein
MIKDQDAKIEQMNQLLTVASAVETFLDGYVKANPGHSLASFLCQQLRARLREVEGKSASPLPSGVALT